MTTKTQIAQMALGHLAIATPLTDVDTDATAIARSIRTYYDIALRQLLEAQPWAFTTRTYDLLAQRGQGTVAVTSNVGTFTVNQDGTLHTGDNVVINGVAYAIGARTSGTVCSGWDRTRRASCCIRIGRTLCCWNTRRK
jgi:hypothetical protein